VTCRLIYRLRPKNSSSFPTAIPTGDFIVI
jgi:hypothetical protein